MVVSKLPPEREFYWVEHVCTTPLRMEYSSLLLFCSDANYRYLEMVRSAATMFPASVYEPPPESASNAPVLNLNLGGVNVSLGGPGGTGVFRSSGEAPGVQADGIRDGVMNLIGKVKQGVDRIAIP